MYFKNSSNSALPYRRAALILQTLSVWKQKKCIIHHVFLLNAFTVNAELTTFICWKLELYYEAKCDLKSCYYLSKSFFFYAGNFTERDKWLTSMLDFYGQYGCKWLTPPGSSALRLSRPCKGTRGNDRLKLSVHKLSKEHASTT